ncbi:MAG: hypothetical protein KDJ16_18540, partial [Hyphomicrobiales bacterium]|nr:hypothetical protein [Hyphomicrobiales bacterium]
ALILVVTLAGLFGWYSAPPGFETSLIDRLAFIGFAALAFYAHFRALRLILRLGRARAEARANAADDDPE